MVNVMRFLNDIVNEKQLYAPMQISDEVRIRAKKSFDKGVECILRTQIIVDGQPTVWCAQHDEFKKKICMGKKQIVQYHNYFVVYSNFQRRLV